MSDSFFFPAVALKECKDIYEATAAISLSSIQSYRILNQRKRPARGMIRSPRQAHNALLQALAKWPEHLTVSLHLVTTPNIDSPLDGKVEICILISVVGTDLERVTAELLSRHAQLFSLLTTFLPEMEFEAVTDETRLNQWIRPFSPAFAYVIDRKSDSFVIVEDDKNNPGGARFGFIQQKRTSSEYPAFSYVFPWHQDEGADLSSVLETILFNPTPLWLQVRFKPSKCDNAERALIEEALSRCEAVINGMRTSTSISYLHAMALRSALTQRSIILSGSVFRGGCFIGSQHHIDSALLGAIANEISSVKCSEDDGGLQLKGGSHIQEISVPEFLDHNHGSLLGPFSIDEASCALRIPWSVSGDLVGLPVKSFRTNLVKATVLKDVNDDGLLIGYNRHRGHIRPIRISDDDRMRHTCILGQTGTGKSVLLESMIVQDINRGKGLCFIDPHGDSIDKILPHYPAGRAEDLVLIDFLDRRRVIPFNILHWQDEEERDRIIDDLYCWIRSVYNLPEAIGPVFEMYYRTYLHVLMHDSSRNDFCPILDDFYRLFCDDAFRDYCTSRVTEYNLWSMISQTNKAKGNDYSLANMAPYITSKFNRFQLDHGLHMMVSQPGMSLDFRDIMDSGKVVMVNLGMARFGSEITGLLASQLISRFQTAALKRIETPPDQRRDFFLYIDEFQNVASDVFIKMLAECRKLRLSVCLSNQYADQLDKCTNQSNNSVLKAVLGNVGMTACFRLGVKDANTMEDVFYPDFGVEDLINLPLGTCYVNLKAGRDNPGSFSLETQPINDISNPEYVGQLKALSNGEYTISATQAYKNLARHNEEIEQIVSRVNRRRDKPA